jgi:hypothetical protein
VQDSGRGDPIVERGPGARIEGVGISPAAGGEVAAVVARGGDREPVQRHAQRLERSSRHRLGIDPPRLSVGLDAVADELAADLDEKVCDTELTQPRRDRIDRVAFGDAGKVERCRPEPPCTQQRGVVLDVTEAGSRYGVGIRQRLRTRWAKAPQVHQRTHRGIEGPVARFGDLEPSAKHARQFDRQLPPYTWRRPVEAAEIGSRFPVAHPRDHAAQDLFDSARPVGRRIDRLHRPGRAHRVAATAVDRGTRTAAIERRRRERRGDRDLQEASTSTTVT